MIARKAGSGTGANSNSIKSPAQSRLPVSAKRALYSLIVYFYSSFIPLPSPAISKLRATIAENVSDSMPSEVGLSLYYLTPVLVNPPSRYSTLRAFLSLYL
jgi:hypothetical protein